MEIVNNMNHKAAVSIDIGTTGISGIAVEIATGRVRKTAARPNGTDLPGEPFERLQAPGRIVERALGLLDELVDEDTVSLGITGQMHGILYIDGHGRAISPLYTWQDESAGQPVEGVTPCERIVRETGWRVSSGYGLATHYAHVLRGRVPEDGAKLCTVMDYLALCLTGEIQPRIHPTNAASLGFYSMETGEFDTAALEKLGMNPGILPEISADFALVGTWRGIPVSVGIGDNQASFLGSVRDPNTMALANLGTGGQISLCIPKGTVLQTDGSLETRPYFNGESLACASSLCAGRAYAIVERFFRSYAAALGLEGEQYEVMNRLAAKGVQEGEVLPVTTTFCGTRDEPFRTASITGITDRNFTPEGLIAGTLAGMAGELYGQYQRMAGEGKAALVLSGNAVRKNPVLREMFGTVFGMETLVPLHWEEAAFGAAMYGALSAGIGAWDEVKQWIQYEKE